MVAVRTGEVKGDVMSGGMTPKPGQYHVTLDEAIETAADVSLSFVVLAGTTPNMEGKKFTHKIFLQSDYGEETVQRALARFAYSLGMLTQEQIESGESFDLNFSEAYGHQAVITLSEHEFDDKDDPNKKIQTVRLKKNQIWPVDHKDVTHVPLDMESIKVAGYTVPPRKGAGTQASPPTQSKPATAPSRQPVGAGAGAKDDFGDI